MATRGTATHRFLGTWRIVDTESWDADALDLLEPAHVTLEAKGHGRLGLVAIEAELDYQVVQRESRAAIEFSFEGSDDGDRTSGRGWAVLDGETLRGRIVFHQGDDSGFTARRSRGRTTGPSRTSVSMTRKAALAALDKKFRAEASAILSSAEVRLLRDELQRVMMGSFPGLSADVSARIDDTIRWHSLASRCAEARGARGIRDVSVAFGIPQYRIKAIEGGHVGEFRGDLARRHFRALGIEEWVARWCHANRELATRVGLLADGGDGPGGVLRRRG